MRREILYFCVLLFLPLLASVPSAQSGADVCPVEADGELTEAAASHREKSSSSKGFTVPRRHVLMEMATSVY